MNKIPGLTYTITHSTDRLRRQQEYVEDEIITSRKLVFGHPAIISNPSFGIVSDQDPTSHVSGGSDPLAVSLNLTDQTTVDINPGIVVFESGSYIEIHDIVRGVVLDDPSVGIPNIIYIRFLLAPGDPVPNFYKQTVVTPYTYRFGDTDLGVSSEQDILFGSMTVDAWEAMSSGSKDEYCVLAVVTMQSIFTGGVVTNELSIDHSDSSYSYNRPWYSAMDVAHRNRVGTGTVSDSNPHGTGPDDLTIGDLTMFDLYLDHGMIIAKDQSVARVPGFKCSSAVTTVQTDDALGTLTGYANAAFIELPYFPVHLGRVRTSAGEGLAALHVPETHRVVFPTEIPPGGATIIVDYTRAKAGEPTLPGNTTFSTEGPGANEIVIAGSRGHTSLNTTEETFADTGMFPMRYDMFIDGDGNVLKTPQVVYCRKKLDDIGAGDSFSITPYGPARLMVGLIGASTTAVTMDVKIKIDGTDSTGTNIDEEFHFTHSDWSDPAPIPFVLPQESPSVRFGSLIFNTVTNLTVTVNTDAGSNAAVVVWMMHTPYDTYDKMKSVAHIATVDWDGTRMANVYDRRIISTTIRDQLLSGMETDAYRHLISMLGGGNASIYIEDFRAPKYDSLMTSKEIFAEVVLNIGRFAAFDLSKLRLGEYGFYRSINLPALIGSGNTWRVTLLGEHNTVDPWGDKYPPLFYYDNGAGWTATIMTPVIGVARTYEAILGGAAATKVRVCLLPKRASGMIIYG